MLKVLFCGRPQTGSAAPPAKHTAAAAPRWRARGPFGAGGRPPPGPNPFGPVGCPLCFLKAPTLCGLLKSAGAPFRRR